VQAGTARRHATPMDPARPAPRHRPIGRRTGEPPGDASGTDADPRGATAAAADTAPARIAALVVIDQLRPDHLERYDSLFTGGLRRMLDEGVLYPRAEHLHAVTQTAPGHATLATGVHPAVHGIVGNDWWERDSSGGSAAERRAAAEASDAAGEQRARRWREVYAVEDPDARLLGAPDAEGRSPVNLRAPTLGEWIRGRHPEARVLSVSKKDRAAISLAGRVPDAHVYWVHHPTAAFTTSTWYRARLPAWVDSVNARVMPGVFADTVWTSGVPGPARALTRPDTFSMEGHGGSGSAGASRASGGSGASGASGSSGASGASSGSGGYTAFPHRAGPEAEAGGLTIREWVAESTPVVDSAVLVLAERGIRALGMGADAARTDYLALSFSQTDYVGHDYGPLSREQLDNLLRLDRTLGRLLETLDAAAGPDGWVLALSSDHGVMTFPQWLERQGVAARRLTDDDEAALERALEAADGPEDAAAAARAIDFSAAAYTHEELRAWAAGEAEPPADDPYVPHYLRTVYEGRHPGDFGPYGVELRYGENVLEGKADGGTTHGSPYAYDRGVPVLFLGRGVRAGRSGARVPTVDVAPTLARLAGVPVPPGLDGRPLGRRPGPEAGTPPDTSGGAPGGG